MEPKRLNWDNIDRAMRAELGARMSRMESLLQEWVDVGGRPVAEDRINLSPSYVNSLTSEPTCPLEVVVDGHRLSCDAPASVNVRIRDDERHAGQVFVICETCSVDLRDAPDCNWDVVGDVSK